MATTVVKMKAKNNNNNIATTLQQQQQQQCCVGNTNSCKINVVTEALNLVAIVTVVVTPSLIWIGNVGLICI